MPEQACDILVLTSYAALEGAAAPFVEEYGARYQVKMTPYQSLYRSDEAITASVDPSAKVIITRGYPATACRRLTDKHVVELSISFQDVLSALDRVLRPDTVRAAVIVYDNMLSGERSMVRLGGLELYFLTLTQFTRNRDKELIVDFLRRNRIQAAVGSALAGEAAGQCGVPFGIIASGERSIARAFEEAAALLERDRAAALRKHAELRSNLNRGWVTRYTFNDILCVSAATEEVKRQARRFAASSRNVLITGETGTGKELFAQSIHSASPRMDRPFISINCGELSESLLESELFGYEKGAYTGASKAGSAGLLAASDQGTLFLDEISEASPGMQTKLLRVIEERTVRRVGGGSLDRLDIRIICATNKDLRQLAEQGKFKRDLYYRLSELELSVPPLSARGADLEYLAAVFARREFYNEYHRAIDPPAEIFSPLRAHTWPGNLRELRSFIVKLVYDCEGRPITAPLVEDFFSRTYRGAGQRRARVLELPIVPDAKGLERELYRALLSAGFGGDREALCKAYGISRTTLWRKLNEK